MKKAFLFIIVLFTFISCEEDISFNNPSFQGVKDNVFWRAIASTASLGVNGDLIIKGYSGNEVITLKTTSTVKGTYSLGTGDSNTAVYELTDASGTLTFATGLGEADGQIVITDYDIENNTISGTFKFNAENSYNNPLAGAVVNFQQGVFYKVPIIAQASVN
ncbi:DUF6252 family protein [Flavobacterium sp. Arc2]|uniref:DUF6252 family protein n=1 Tax=Flavobacterium sp. Arc2 TaxID=3046685 RepID=UPI00352ECB76